MTIMRPDIGVMDSLLTAKCIDLSLLYNNQINAHALIGQSAMGYCASKPMEKLRVFLIII